jgi:hypothetical protein
MGRLAALGTALMLMAAFAGPALAAPSTVRAVIHEDFGKRASARPCTPIDPQGVTCAGDGIVATVGRVTSSADYVPDENVVRVITFADGSTVTVEETYSDPDFPGQSHDAPGSLQSYGNPLIQPFTWVVVGSTGAFAGATGSGTGTAVQAGDTLTFTFEGTVSTP